MMKPSKASHGPGRPPEHCFEDDLNILLAFARYGAVSGRRDLMEVLSLDKDSVNKALATLTEPSDVDAEAVFVVENAYAGRRGASETGRPACQEAKAHNRAGKRLLRGARPARHPPR